MNGTMRWLLLMLTLVWAFSTAQGADVFPSKPIRMVVPWPAGGVVDLRARVVSDRLSKRLGQQVVVENRPGASAMIGAQAVARAAADGYTLLYGSFIDQAAILSMMKEVPYDPAKDFAPIIPMGRSCLLLVVHASLQVDSLEKLIETVRSHPGKFNYASSGPGTPQHLLMEQLKQTAQLDIPVVHYKGGGPAVQDVVAGHVPMMFEFAGTIAPHVKSGSVRPLMTACAHRIDAFPDVRSAPEAGFPKFGIATWGGLFAPNGTPKPIIDRLNKEVAAVLSDPEVRSGTAFLGAEVPIWTPEQFAEFIAADRPRWVSIVKAAGIQPQ